MSYDGRILWADIESDSFEPGSGFLLEVGFRITTSDLTTLAEISRVVPYRAEALNTIRGHAVPNVRAMHEANGLWEACERAGGMTCLVASSMRLTGPSLGGEVGDELLAWLRDNNAYGLPLAGSSVHTDRAWLNDWLPTWRRVPKYRNIDVSSWRELLQRWAPSIVESAPGRSERHRVLACIDDSIAQLAHYRAALGLDDTEDGVPDLLTRTAVVTR